MRDPGDPFPTLRPGTPDDAATIAALATQVFLDTYATDGVRPDLAREAFHVYSTQAFAQRLAEPDRRFTIATRGEGLLGFAEVLCSAQAAPAGPVTGAELVRLYVQPQAQGQGLGQLLLEAAEATCAQSHLWLTAWEGNTRALAFYPRRGYADVGRTTYTFEGQTYITHVFAKGVLR